MRHRFDRDPDRESAARPAVVLPFVVFAAVLVAVWAFGFTVSFLTSWPIRGTGSGGIGSVSGGISGAIVESFLAALVAVIVVAVANVVRARRPPGPPSDAS